LHPTMTDQDLEEGCKLAAKYGVASVCIKPYAVKRAVELLTLVGLEKRMHFRPNRLSGGEQQRVALCRALMNDPEMILADEPTGQLDSKTAGEIISLLSEMNKRGKTVILVTHDAAIAANAQRVIRISDGVIIDE